MSNNSRIIKFRVWDKCRKKYNEDSYGKNELISVALGFNSDVCVSKNDLILQQYTGLLDKNGKEIYEGDIIKFCGKYGVAVFRDGCFQLKGKFEPAYRNTKDGNVYRLLINSLSIETDDNSIEQPFLAGNIFENPELLKIS
jgi:uncharacterized phage protein (TIGR01671 family)